MCMFVDQEEMSRAQVVILHGHQLAANHHYALALIIQRCNELRHHCDVITTAIRTKRASLTRARVLLHRLEGVKSQKIQLKAVTHAKAGLIQLKVNKYMSFFMHKPKSA